MLKPHHATTALSIGLVTVLCCGPVHADEATIEALKREIESLKSRVEELENKAATTATPNTLSSAVVGSERPAEDEPSEDQNYATAAEPDVRIGGALRFNLIYRDDVDASVGKRGESGLDVFRFNVDGSVDNILISAEYRFYPYMNTLHHGWVGYQFADDSQLQFGVSQVPFGLLPYASHNAWYGVPYYVGLADDYDMGIKYQRSDGAWRSHLAFYKNEELNDATNLDRYSFDLVRQDEQQNEEVNQANARLAYTFGYNSNCETELGTSLEAGEIYNATTDARGDHWAAAVHLDSRCGRWNMQMQGVSYQYNPANPDTVDDSSVRMGAFAGGYDIASDAEILVFNLAYNFPPPWKELDSLTCYNDYSRLNKSLAGATDSQINTLGCAIGAGPLFTYVDYIYARNMPYFGNGSLAGDGEDDWEGRFNVNVGFYW